jgi:hypothetical protein
MSWVELGEREIIGRDKTEDLGGNGIWPLVVCR